MNANLLLLEIMKQGLTLDDLSNLLGTSQVLAYRKLNDINLLTIGEALHLKAALELSDQEAAAIFLGA